HEKVHALLNLPRLIAGPRHHQVFGQLSAHPGKSAVDRLAKFTDRLTRSHLYRQRNRPASTPLAVLILPIIEVQVTGRARVRSRDVEEVAEIHRRARLRKRYDHVADLLLGFELSRRIYCEVLALHVDLAAGYRDVACLEDVGQL